MREHQVDGHLLCSLEGVTKNKCFWQLSLRPAAAVASQQQGDQDLLTVGSEGGAASTPLPSHCTSPGFAISVHPKTAKGQHLYLAQSSLWFLCS